MSLILALLVTTTCIVVASELEGLQTMIEDYPVVFEGFVIRVEPVFQRENLGTLEWSTYSILTIGVEECFFGDLPDTVRIRLLAIDHNGMGIGSADHGKYEVPQPGDSAFFWVHWNGDSADIGNAPRGLWPIVDDRIPSRGEVLADEIRRALRKSALDLGAEN